MDEQIPIKLTNAIYCLCECMGMQAENNLRMQRGESLAYHGEDFEILVDKCKNIHKECLSKSEEKGKADADAIRIMTMK